MDDKFDIGMFIVVSTMFVVIPLCLVLFIVNFFITNRMTKRRQYTKSKLYWPKLIGFSLLALFVGLLAYNAYYKLAA